jgi:hypothetical protein
MADTKCIIEMSDNEYINMVNVFRVEFDPVTWFVRFYSDTTNYKQYNLTEGEFDVVTLHIKRDIGVV